MDDYKIEIPDFSGFKVIPSREKHYCFGCSPRNEHGLNMRFYTDDLAVFSKLKIKDHLCGWNNMAHGGIISTILDEIMAWGAIYLLKRYILTKSMTVEYLKPVFKTNTLFAKGFVLKHESDRKALMQGLLYNQDGQLCAKSEGTFVLLTREGFEKFGFVDDEMLEEFSKIMTS